MEVATVDEKIVWKILMPRNRRWAATARSVPSTRPTGTVYTTYTRLCPRPERKSELVSTSRSWP